MKLQNLRFKYNNLIHTLRKHHLIKFLKFQCCGTGFLEDTLWDVLISAASAFFLLSGTNPKHNFFIVGGCVLGSVVPGTAYIIASAPAAFQLARKTSDVQGFICKGTQFSASFHLRLHIIKCGFVDNGFVVLLYIELLHLTTVLFSFLGDGV